MSRRQWPRAALAAALSAALLFTPIRHRLDYWAEGGRAMASSCAAKSLELRQTHDAARLRADDDMAYDFTILPARNFQVAMPSSHGRAPGCYSTAISDLFALRVLLFAAVDEDLFTRLVAMPLTHLLRPCLSSAHVASCRSGSFRLRPCAPTMMLPSSKISLFEGFGHAMIKLA